MPAQECWPEGWDLSGLPEYPAADCRRIAAAARETCAGEHAADFAAACRDFYLCRYLHWHAVTPAGVLLGDYFFSLFSQGLIPLDSVALTEAFSDYLAAGTQSPPDLNHYLEFLKQLKAVIDS